MAKKKRRGSGHHILAEINITPLVDVVLVLLVIFLIISPMLFRFADVDLPRSQTAFAASGLEGHITLTIQTDGTLFYEDRAISTSILKDELRQDLQQNPNMPVLIRGDGNLPYSKVKRVMDVCHLVGVGDIRLATAEAGSR